MKKTVSLILLLVCLSSLVYYFMVYNKKDGIAFLQKKYKGVSPTIVKLSSPTPLKIEDTAKIILNNEAYTKEMVGNTIAYYQSYMAVLIDAKLKDSISKKYNKGIRILKGIGIGAVNQNLIVKYLESDGVTRNGDRNFLVLKQQNMCPNYCDRYSLIHSKIPSVKNSEMINNLTSGIIQSNYDKVNSKDYITSCLIPKTLLDSMLNNKISFFVLFNGIDDNKNRILYILSYDTVGRLVIDASFSLDETYLCPNYCDGTKYDNL
jgi:hypothetical protein